MSVNEYDTDQMKIFLYSYMFDINFINVMFYPLNISFIHILFSSVNIIR